MSVETVARWIVREDGDPWEGFARRAGIAIVARHGLTRAYHLCARGGGCEVYLPDDLNPEARARHLKEQICDMYLEALGPGDTLGQLARMVAALTVTGTSAEDVAAD